MLPHIAGGLGRWTLGVTPRLRRDMDMACQRFGLMFHVKQRALWVHTASRNPPACRGVDRAARFRRGSYPREYATAGADVVRLGLLTRDASEQLILQRCQG